MFKILNSQKGIAQILILLILLGGIVAGVWGVQYARTVFKPKAYDNPKQIEELSNSLLNLNSQDSPVNSKQTLENMISIASKRKEELLKEIEENPQSFLKNARLSNVRDKFPKEVQEFIEEELDAVGEVAILHSDNFKDKQSTEYPALIVNKTTYKIYFDNKVTKVRTGDQVKTKGITLGGSLVPQDFTVLSEAPIGSLGPDTRRTIRLGVMLMEFEGDIEVINRESIRTILFGSKHSLDDYYKVNSYGRLSITGNIWPVVIKGDHDKCNHEQISRWIEAADQMLLDQGINRDEYYSIVYIFPPDNPCRYVLLPTATVGRGNQPSIIWLARESDNLAVYAHELGHNLGVNHANVLYCGDKAIGSKNQCQSIEYADQYDPMGNNDNLFHMNAPHKLALGFIMQFNTINIDYGNLRKNGGSPIRVTVLPLERRVDRIETPDANLSAANVFMIGQYGNYISMDAEYYLIEYRQPVDYDLLLPSSSTRGVLIHLGNPGSHNRPEYRTNLINTGAEYSSHNIEEVALSDGQIFEDYTPIYRLRIKQISHDTEGAVLEISGD